MEKVLSGRKIAILAAGGFDERSMATMQRHLLTAGAAVKTISSDQGLMNSWNGTGWGHCFSIDCRISETLSVDFDMLIVLPGERSIAKLLTTPHTERIVTGFVEGERPMAIMGDAITLLAEIDQVKDVKVSGPETAKEAVEAKGAVWSDDTITMHNMIMTGDISNDENLNEYIRVMTEMFANYDATEELMAA